MIILRFALKIDGESHVSCFPRSLLVTLNAGASKYTLTPGTALIWLNYCIVKLFAEMLVDYEKQPKLHELYINQETRIDTMFFYKQ